MLRKRAKQGGSGGADSLVDGGRGLERGRRVEERTRLLDGVGLGRRFEARRVGQAHEADFAEGVEEVGGAEAEAGGADTSGGAAESRMDASA